ncbi:MAG TPA: hypothetical protein PLY32_00930 [Salinivirgaceae bacterium]|mgnify:CR=1 FL=1|nr:hypothetical protein [Salinivirgaceae bacterium]HQA75660.1 hypothetical protein [Salinivirgaceae bacterium]
MTNKNKILVRIIVLLAILNLTTIISILHHRYKDKQATETVIVTGEGQNPLSGRFFMQEVGFDDEQMEQFRQINRKFKPKSNQIILQMDSIKVLIFDELNKQNVDTTRLKQLNTRFGELHAELKDETNNFYLKLKEISNTEQTEKLKNAFKPLFYKDNAIHRGRGSFGRQNQFYKREIQNKNNN